MRFEMHPTEQQQVDFLDKVLPLAERAVASENFVLKRGNAVSRALNLAMGLQPRKKAERQLQDVLLSMIALAHPRDEYPDMCAPPQALPSVH